MTKEEFKNLKPSDNFQKVLKSHRLVDTYNKDLDNLSDKVYECVADIVFEWANKAIPDEEKNNMDFATFVDVAVGRIGMWMWG